MANLTLILGIRGAYCEFSACLIQDDHLTTVLEEERFSRVKHGKPDLVDKADELPEQAIAFSLQSGGQTICEALYGPLVLWAIQHWQNQAISASGT